MNPVIIGGAPNNTTISTAGTYVEPTGGAETTLAVGAANNVGGAGQQLFWSTNYTTQSNTTTQITYYFNRPVNNLSIRLNDVDRNTTDFIDAVTFDAYQANGVLLNMNATADATVLLNNPDYTSRTNNTILGARQNPDVEQNGTVTVTFNKPITRFVITYENRFAIADPGIQYIGIDYITWCTQANVATTLSGPARALPGSQVTYTVTTTASGDYAATGVRPQVQLSAGLNSQNPVFPAGSSYDNTTGLLTLATIPNLAVGAISTSTIRFNMPSTTIAGTASSTIDTDDSDPSDNNGSLLAARVTTTTNQAPTAQAKSATVTRNSAVFTALPALTGTDPDNDALTYTIDGSSIANIGFGTVSFVRDGIRTNLSGTDNVTLNGAEAASLEFKAVATGAATGNSGTLRYTAADGFGGVSALANYTITVGDRPAVYSSPNTYQRGAVTNNQILASVTDPDGTITNATLTGALPAGLVFYSTTTTVGNGSNQITFPAGSFVALNDNKNSPPAAGTYTFTVTTSGAANGSGTTNSIPVTIKIIGTDAVAVYSTNNVYNRDALTAGATLATVTDPDAAITSAARVTGTLGTGMNFNTTTGQFTTTSTSVPFAGTYTYTVTTTDAVGGSSTNVPVTITVRDDIEAAYSNVQAYNVDALTANSSLATVTDQDGALTSAALSSGSLPAGTTLNSITGQFMVSNTSALTLGNYSFTVNTLDATGGKSTLNVGVTLFETESVYATTPEPSGTYSDGYALANVTDVDGPISNAVLNNSTLPAGVGLNSSTGQFTVTNRLLLRSGTYPVEVRTADATGGLTTQIVNIVIKQYPCP
ncbi:DUF11 domain-containing protein [Hymenobacter sp. 5516J-16]|uniref:beta strand repeat-containing protein n=1 Tax=Hymenobacter sp. 5516J-16 TaxID=2932253 RepID=UPI001FD2CD87|nr:DUF11 domain-containing protein [Hymenobacter sp. 5516J-16]UOQ78962.1 DUF11 domain-containing protein [Hymenobacter sp. 5516J-16]